MRRRIYIAPDGPLEDTTGQPYLFQDDDMDGTNNVCRRRALYSDHLWNLYQRALTKVRKIERQILEQLIDEPYDEVELDCKRRFNEIGDEFSLETIELIEQKVLENAKARRKL